MATGMVTMETMIKHGRRMVMEHHVNMVIMMVAMETMMVAMEVCCMNSHPSR
jgi:hypothetical protein